MLTFCLQIIIATTQKQSLEMNNNYSSTSRFSCFTQQVLCWLGPPLRLLTYIGMDGGEKMSSVPPHKLETRKAKQPTNEPSLISKAIISPPVLSGGH